MRHTPPRRDEKIAVVHWLDSQVTTSQDGWMTPDDFQEWVEAGVIEVSSVGFVTYEGNDFIVLSMSTFNGDLAECCKIPRSAIVGMSWLRGAAQSKTDD